MYHSIHLLSFSVIHASRFDDFFISALWHDFIILLYFQVGVHIADVSHFIRPGTAIDKEAANRSTTVYLTDRRIDMVIFKFFIITPLNKFRFLSNVICVVQKCVKRIELVNAPNNLTNFLLHFLGSRVTLL